jgi:hypothetical protein
MGRQAKLRKLRKTLKDEPFMQELVENVGFIHEKLTSLNVLPIAENVQALFEFVSSIERPENMTEDQFNIFLDEKMTDFIKNNLQ